MAVLFCLRIGKRAQTKDEDIKRGGNGMKNDRYDKALLLFLAAGLLLCGALALFFPAPRLSERENRTLADKPRFSLHALVSGKWGEETDRYVTERFRLREECRALRAVAELSVGKREVSGIILGKDGSLLRRGNANRRIFSANLHGLQKTALEAAGAGIPFTVAAVPRAADVRADARPNLYQGETEFYDTFKECLPGTLPLTELEEKNSFYATDHHLTTAGAYRAYRALCPALGITPYIYEDFVKETVSTAFFGTADAAAGIPGVSPDKMELFRFEGDDDFVVIRDGTPASFSGFYDREKLTHRDQYAVFLGGNAGITEIRQKAEDSRPVLLLWKDSYANALIPFFARHFRILAIDPRYTSAPYRISDTDADRVLVFCGMQSLTETAMFH